MVQKELQMLVANNRLLSKEQKYLLFEKIKWASDEQIIKLIEIFSKSNEKYKPLLITKLKRLHLRSEKIKSLFQGANKKVLKKNGDVVQKTEEVAAERMLNQELKKLEKKSEKKKGFFRKLWNLVLNFFRKK